mmetsp:Transcript_48030/g.51970  ORF Transcript_48030/g.51970 Transcript_48030/m.51970 type:complete len:299 (-) Transcript_48030:96-992(-)
MDSQQQQQQQHRDHNYEGTTRFHFPQSQKPQQQPMQSLSLSSLHSEPNIISTDTKMMMDAQFVQVNTNNVHYHQHQYTSINNNKCPNRRSPNKKRRGGGGKKKIKGVGRDGGRGRGRGRQWQLPESSVDEYMKWIQEKPEKDQTSSELQFLWKYMIQRLDVVKKDGNGNGNGRRRRQERIKEFVERLQDRPPNERSIQEEHFVRLYHRRKKNRKAQRKQQEDQQQQHQPNDEMIVSWMRVNNKNEENNNIGDNIDTNCKYNNNKTNKGLEPMASLASLRENMMKLGLSSDKIKQVRFA